MKDTKKVRRSVALPRLHQSIEEFRDSHSFTNEQSIGELLDAIQAEWFSDAKTKG